MKSTIVKRSVVVTGHKSSVSIEEHFWAAMKEIALSRQQTLSELVSQIDASRDHNNLSSAIRLFVLDYYQSLQPANGAGSKSNR
jgi:predicted DNA-binding ribbon-helix-helix protein